jgi:hypothetical protein
MNEQTNMQNRRFEPTGVAKPAITGWLIGTGAGLVEDESADLVFGQIWN